MWYKTWYGGGHEKQELFVMSHEGSCRHFILFLNLCGFYSSYGGHRTLDEITDVIIWSLLVENRHNELEDG